MQPASNFAKWQARGVNTIVTDKSKPDSPPETAASRTGYFNAAQAASLSVIIGPDAADTSRPGLLAWSQKDEPEDWGHVLKNADGSFDWKATTDGYISDYARFKSFGTSVPVFGNFNGGPILSARESDTNPKNVTLPMYREFAKGTDWLAADFYIRPQGRPPEQIANYGKVQDRLALIAPGKPSFAIVECADQGLTGGAAPSASEVRAAVWIAIIHGARGIIFFPLKVQGGFSFDNTPPDVAAAMPGIAAELQDNADFILSGQSGKDAASESAIWTLADGSTLKATATFSAGAWTVKVEPHRVMIDPEKEAMRARLKRIDGWRAAYPVN